MAPRKVSALRRTAVNASASQDEYLSTSYRPDREFIDGEVIERHVGEFDHSSLLMKIAAWFYVREREWNIRVLPEQRLQVSARRFRVPDVCVFSRVQQIEPVFTKPPLICIEVLSKDDTLRTMQDRVDDYRAFGVPHIWVLDPVKQRAYMCERGDFSDLFAEENQPQ